MSVERRISDIAAVIFHHNYFLDQITHFNCTWTREVNLAPIGFQWQSVQYLYTNQIPKMNNDLKYFLPQLYPWFHVYLFRDRYYSVCHSVWSGVIYVTGVPESYFRDGSSGSLQHRIFSDIFGQFCCIIRIISLLCNLCGKVYQLIFNILVYKWILDYTLFILCIEGSE